MKSLVTPVIIWLILSSVFPIISWRTTARALRVLRNSHFVDGTVVELRPQFHQNVVVRYEVNGMTYRTDTFQPDRYGLPSFKELKVGDKVPVNYNPAFPQNGFAGYAEKNVVADAQDSFFFSFFWLLITVSVVTVRHYLVQWRRHKLPLTR
ncbi:MAG TPA: hypothetical protein VJP02_23950 [Candidatus Sulfotelmatobacter sp.]|nr:hypothetical protein [Candidatus Sulfotelmatobacter sp.]